MKLYTINLTGSKAFIYRILEENHIEIDYCSKNFSKIKVYLDQKKLKKLINKGILPKLEKEKYYKKNKSINKKLGQYHFQKDLEVFLNNNNKKYPNITKNIIIGKSVKNRKILIMEISSNKKTKTNKPGFLVTANIHGDETIGRELALYLIDHLTYNYNKDPLITFLLDNTNIFINPSLNPDGFEKTIFNMWIPSRFNHNNVDLNRNFPDRLNKNKIYSFEPEIKSFLNWSSKNIIHSSISIHSGSVVVNYPFDGPISKKYCATEEDDYFKYISKQYSKNCDYFKKSRFKNGITNGAEWYAINGGMQDWRYGIENGYEITLELSEEKVVPEEKIEWYWNKNKLALVNSIRLLHIGIKVYFKNVSEQNVFIILENKQVKKKIYYSRNTQFIPLKPDSYIITYKNKQNQSFNMNILITQNSYIDLIINDINIKQTRSIIPKLKNIVKKSLCNIM